MAINYFLKSYNLKSIGKKFILLYVLNITDILFTLFLLHTGLFDEGNVLMKEVIDNNILSIIIKALLPITLLIIIYLRMQKATIKQLYISNIVIIVCLALYFLINISHLFWIAVYIFIFY